MIKEARILKKPKIIWTIIKNFPTLDILPIFQNAKLYYIEKNKKIISFLSIKKWKDSTEIGTVYTHPNFRNKGFSRKIIKFAIKKYQKVGLICKENLIPFYKKVGLKLNSTKNQIEKRKNMFNKYLANIFGYKLVAMRN